MDGTAPRRRRTPWPDARRTGGQVVAALSLLLPLGILAVLTSFPDYDLVFESVDFHLAAVGAISACALGVAVAAAVAARRTGQGALVVLAVGCLGVGAFMLGHGLTTPGIFGRPLNLWVARLPVLALTTFAVCLALAATRPSGRLLRAVGRRPAVVLAVTGGVFAAITAFTVLWPDLGIGARVLASEALLRRGLLGAAVVLLGIAGVVHWRRWRLSHDRVQLALVVAAFQGVGATLSFELGRLWHLAWWDYHAYLFIGFAATIYAILRSSWRRSSVDDVLGTVYAADPLEHIERGYSDALRVLVAAVEARDRHTHGHSVRVAELAVRIGQRHGLRAGQLRVLAEGAYLHDVGKIGVPDHVLNKPGALTDDEWIWIKQHPIVGVDIAERAPSLHPALAMIRHHHERYDGSGYPDGLAGEDIPLLARIVAVADVWDALTSERSYREAWRPDEALAHMLAGRGSHFDPRCLDIFATIAADLGVTTASTRGNGAVAGEAANACHHHADVGAS